MKDNKNEVFAVHYRGNLIDKSSYHTRNGRVYVTIGPAKGFVTKVKKWLIKNNRESEVEFYSVVRYVPEETYE